MLYFTEAILLCAVQNQGITLINVFRKWASYDCRIDKKTSCFSDLLILKRQASYSS